MKIAFLDIDGVLAVNYRREPDGFGSGFHPEFVENLRRLIERTGCYLVISSTWRGNGLIRLLEMWEKRGLPGHVMDVTGHARGEIYHYDPQLYDGKAFERHNITIPRGCEIEAWLSRVGKFQRINWSKQEQLRYIERAHVKNYVILDDDSDFLYHQREHFVQCSNRWTEPDAVQGLGFTLRALEQAVTILNTPLEDIYYPNGSDPTHGN